MKLITVDQVKDRQRWDAAGADALIEDAIEGASKAIVNYVTSSDPDWLDSNGEPEEDSNGIAINIPADVQTACNVLTGMILRDPSGKDGGWEPGFLPAPVLCWLTPYRLPTLA